MRQAERADHITRHPGDIVRVVCGAAVTLFGAWLARGGRVGVTEEAAFRLVNRLPDVFAPPLTAVMQAGALAAVGVAAGIAVAGRRRRLAVDLVLGGGGTWLAIKLAKLWVQRMRPGGILADVIVRGAEQTGLGYPSGHVAVAAALATVAGPWLPRPWRRTLWAVVGVVAVARMYVGAHLPLDVVGGATFGWTIGALVHLARGAPGGLPDVGLVTAALASLRLQVVVCTPLFADARGSTPFRAETADGRRWFVKVVGAEQRDADVLFKLYRYLIFRELEDERPFASAKQMVEHEAYVALLAARYGARVPDVAGAVETTDGSGVLVQALVEGVGADTLSADELCDPLLTGMWRQVALLHDHRIAHRDLRLANWVVGNDGAVTLTDFGFAESAAGGRRLAQDVAELLVATGAIVGADRATTAAHAVMGTDALRAALPLLQPLALSSATRAAARGGELGRIRAAVAGVTGMPAPPPTPLTRLHVRPRVVAGLAGLAFAVHLLLPQVGEVGRTIATLRAGRWDWLVAAVVFASVRYVASAVALLGASPIPLPLGRTTLVQVAGSAAGKLAPAGLAGLGITERFLERSGATRTDAVAAVGLDTLAGLIAHAALLAAAAAVVGQDPLRALRAPRDAVPLGLLAALAIAIGLFVGRRWAPRRVVLPAARAWQNLRTALASPRRGAALFGGSAALTLTMIGCLFASLHAFTPSARVGAVALAYLIGAAVGSAAPTPGGLGVTEAALVAGLVGTGVATAPAIAGVLVFRLLTFWVPTLPGAIALRRLAATGAV